MTVSKRRVWIITLVAVIISSVVNVGNFLQAYATSDNDIVSQVLIHDLQVCYTNGKFNSSITVDLSSFNGLTNEWTFAPRLPNGFLNKDTIKCGDIVRSLYGLDPRTADDLIKMLDAFGYEPSSTNEPSQKCISFKFNRYGSGGRTEVRTQQICAEVDANNNVIGDTFTIGADGTDDMNTFFFLPNEGCYGCLSMSRNDGQAMYSIASISIYQNRPWSELEIALTNEINRQFDTQNGLTYNPLGADVEDKKNATTYVLKDGPFWQSTYASQFRKFSNTEIVYTYQRYLQMYANIVCTSDPSDIAILTGTTQNGGYRQVKIAGKSGYNENCFVKLKDSAPSSFHGFTSDGYWNKDVFFDDDILNTLGAITLTPEELEELDSNIDNSDNDPGDLTDKPDSTNPSGGVASNQLIDTDDCMAIGGSMGWIVCPALQALKSALETVYDNAIEPLLQVRAGVMDRSSGTYKAWESFRNIANIFFVILILVVIFSQVTGYGIDNYGIKRMLPRLIMMAVLLNFSFIICQLAVDISNILGAGFNSFFTNLANTSLGSLSFEADGINETITAGPGFLGNVLGVSFAFIAAVAGGKLAFMVFTGTGLLLSLLVTCLGAIVSVIFMFVSLGVRMAGIIILTAISPIAFVAYALPNTNGIFKKWFDLFKALLLLYPICGLLIGGGQFAALVLLNTLPQATDNGVLRFFYTIIAILLAVVPFLALPALLKRSISALGGAGATLAGLGARLSSATTSGIRNSEAYKRRVTQMNANSAKRVAGAMSFGENKKGWRRVASAPIRALGRGRMRAAAANMAAGKKMDREYASAAAMLGSMTDNKNIGDLQKDFIAANERGDEQAISVALNRMTSMDAKAAQNFITDQVSGLDNLADDRQQREMLRRIKSAVDGNDTLSKSLATKDPGVSRMLANNGQLNGSYSNLAGFTRSFAETADAKDVAGLSSGALARAVNSGGLTDTVRRELLTSNDPAIRTALDSDEAKRNILDAMQTGANIDFTDRGIVAQYAQQYRDATQRDQEFQVRQQARQAAAAQQQVINEIGKSVARNINSASSNNNPGNSSPDFEGGAGI